MTVSNILIAFDRLNLTVFFCFTFFSFDLMVHFFNWIMESVCDTAAN